MKIIKLFIIASILIVTSCKDDKPLEINTGTTTTSTFYLIRHAEKDRLDSENVDPELTQKGLGRAMHWAEILDEVPLDAIYSTNFNRTSMTAAPTSVKKNIDVQYYDAEIINIERFVSENENKKVLIVGHSNTIPDLVNRIIGEEKYNAIDDYENGSLFIVQITNGVVSDTKLKFNCNCPD